MLCWATGYHCLPSVKLHVILKSQEDRYFVKKKKVVDFFVGVVKERWKKSSKLPKICAQPINSH